MRYLGYAWIATALVVVAWGLACAVADRRERRRRAAYRRHPAVVARDARQLVHETEQFLTNH